MSRQRSGPIFTQEILNNLIRTMEGQIPTDQSDEIVFQEKVRALQRFLHHGMSRFSTESLQQVLDSILPPKTPDTAWEREDGRPPRRMEVRSIKELRDVVKMIMTKRESGSIRASDRDALKYMEHFFYAIYCMSEAKRLIDDVFADLYYSYYKPESESRQPTRLGSDIVSDTGQSARHVTEDYSQFGISTLEQLTGSTGHKLRLTVRDMQDVLTRWAELLTQGEPDPTNFEPESEQDLLLVRTAFHTQPILRLLPDTFAKFYKCLELSKQWWVLAHDVYPDLPFQRHPLEEPEKSLVNGKSPSVESENLDQEEADLTDQVVLQTKEAIREINDEIEAVQEELEALSKREEKFSILVETYEKVGRDIETRSRERQRLYALKDRLEQSGQKNAINKEELLRAEAEIKQLDGMLKLLEFQHSLLLQDYLIHMEIRPSIIRFQGEAALRLKHAQVQLEEQALNLEKLEHGVSSPPPSDDIKTKENREEDISKHSSLSHTTLSGEEEDDEEQKMPRREKNMIVRSKDRKSSTPEIDKNHILQRSNNKRQVAFVHTELNKGDAVFSNKKPPLTQVRLNEKSQAVTIDSVQPPAKPADRRIADNGAVSRTKRNSLPDRSGPQTIAQHTDRRGSHDISNTASEKTDSKLSRPMRKDSTGKLNLPKISEPKKKYSIDEQEKTPAGDKRVNQKTRQQTDRRGGHDISTTATDKTEAEVLRPMRKDSTGKLNSPKTSESISLKKQSIEDQEKIKASDRRVNQVTTQQTDRRGGHDISVTATDKTDAKASKPIRKDSTGKVSPPKTSEPAKKHSIDEQEKITIGDRKVNPLLKSKSSRDVISKQVSPGSIQSPRSRSSSDPPTTQSGKDSKKSNMSKALEKVSTPPNAATAQRDKGTRLKSTATLKNKNG